MEMIICWILFGAVCYLIAKNKNRNEWLAAAMGALFGVFALIYYIAVSKLPAEGEDATTPTTKV